MDICILRTLEIRIRIVEFKICKIVRVRTGRVDFQRTIIVPFLGKRNFHLARFDVGIATDSSKNQDFRN